MDQQLSDLYEPKSRFYHVASSISDGPGQVIVWGGRTSEVYSDDGRIQLASVVEQFDVHSEVWRQRSTRGTPHPGLYGAACTSFGNSLFVYGGITSHCRGALSYFDLNTLTWSQLSPEVTADGPMRKFGCGMVYLYNDKLVLIGGYGIPTGRIQPESTFIRNTKFTGGRGWTNEIHVFDISQGVWLSPTVRETRPPPCSHFTLTSIDNHRAVLFGGNQSGRDVVNDLYIIDFNTMEITKVEPREGEPWPEARDDHAACCLRYAGDHIHLLVIGGRARDETAFDDMWLFNVSLKQWKEVTLPDGTLPRRGHSATAITLCPGLVEVIVFGGTIEGYVDGEPDSSYSRLAETMIISFGLIGSEWELVGVANNSQQGTSERVREKMLLKSGTDTQDQKLSFNLESPLTTYGLYRLEKGGVQWRREISTKNRDFQAVLRQKQPDANLAMIKWVNSVQQTAIKPSWRNLVVLLRLINLDHLAEKINQYLSGAAVKQVSSEGTSASMEQTAEESLSEVFSLASLTQLEKREGIPVLTELEAKNHEFQAVIRVKQPNLSWAINKWLTAPVLSRIKPSWKNLLSVLRLVNLDHLAEEIERYSKEHSLSSLKEEKVGDIEKLGDEVLALCDKLKEGDVDENIRHLRYKVEILSKAATEQIKEKTATEEMLLADQSIETFQPSPKMMQPQLGTAEETKAVKKELYTSTQGTVSTGALSLVKKEPLEEALMSTATAKLLALFDELKEGDVDENIRHLKYKTESLLKAASEQVKKMDTIDMLLADPKKLQSSFMQPQLGTAEGTMVGKTEPASPSVEKLETSTQAVAMTTLPLIKKEPIEEPLMSTATELDVLTSEDQQLSQLTLVQSPGGIVETQPTSAQLTADTDVNTELDMLRRERQQLKSRLALVQSPGGIMDPQPTSVQLTGFRGVEVCGETTVVVTNNPQSFIWEGFGLKLHIPQGCLPVGMQQCLVSIQASLAGQYEFPESSHLVSAVFWLRCVPKCKFQKQVHLEINHCVKSENISKLSFVKALCTQKELPYTFQKVGGKFNRYSSYGVIDLESFSGLSVVQDGSDEREYCAMLFYINQTTYSHKIHFVIVWNSEAHLNVVKGDYKEKNASLGADQLVEFKSDEITLNIPQEGITLDEGWKIMPYIAPVVLKKHVDSYQPGRRIPSCQLSATFTLPEDRKVPLLQHQVELVGAKEPFNMMAIELPTISEFNDRKRRQEQSSTDLETGPSPKKQHTEPQSVDRSPDSGQGITTEDVAFQAGLRLDVLSKECSEAVLLHVAKLCVDWQLLGKYLKLTEAEIAAVDGDNKTVEEKRVAMLEKWKEKLAYKATGQALVEALLATGKSSCAIDAAKIIGAAGEGPPSIKIEPHTQSRECIKKRDDKPTLKYLMKELHPKASDKWEDLGIELEVDDELLVQIKKDYSGDSRQCLREMLRGLLKMSPSWEAIAQATADLGEEKLATQLRSKYCNGS